MNRFAARAVSNAFCASLWCVLMTLAVFVAALEWVFAWCEAEA